MCGIAGIAAFPAAPDPTMAQIKAMCDTIAHRGPDDEGIDVRGGIAFGMRRLAIIDLRGGRQPIFNEDQTVRTVFNGEIYNFRELRTDLRKKGHIFSTDSDTEVLVHGYEEFGTGLPERLNGMFAFAIHDLRNNTLLLARDPIGIKPLFYAFNQHYLIWGSEIKAILASGLLDRELDMDALGELLSWEYIPGSGTLFKAIRKLEPGQLLHIDLAAPVCAPKSYWDIPAPTESLDLNKKQWEEAVHAKLKACVRRQLVSDVPLGAFLSGGIDSSLVASAIPDAQTFSIGFNDPSYNELPYARKVASHLNLQHTCEIIEPTVFDLFDKLLYFMDDPIGDFSIFPTYLVSQLARRHVTVVLSGDGGDELFGGYETYKADTVGRFYRHVPAVLRQSLISPLVSTIRPRSEKKGIINKLKRFVEGMEQPEELSHARWRIFLSEALRNRVFTRDALAQMTRPAGAHIVDLFHQAGKRTPLASSLYVDVKSYLCDNCLVKVDRMSMAVSLEARVPFLDKELVELAFMVPDSLKLARGETKRLLKTIAAGVIPPECVYRPKEGFSIPMKHWLGTQFRPLMEDLLDRRKLRSQGIFCPDMVQALIKEHLTGVANHSHLLWALMIFQAWRGRWLCAN